MKVMKRLYVFIPLLLISSCVSPYSSQVEPQKVADSSGSDLENKTIGWTLMLEKEGQISSRISNDYIISSEEFTKIFSNQDYLEDDPINGVQLSLFQKQRKKLYTEHSIRFAKNKFMSIINPEMHSIDKLDFIVNKWKRNILSGEDRPNEIFNEYLGAFKQEENLCWLSALQFLYFYQNGILLEEKQIFENATNKDSILTQLLGTGFFREADESSKNELKNIPAGFLEILSGYGKGSCWNVTNSEGTLLINALRNDVPLILGRHYRENENDIRHIVVVLGATYSVNTSVTNFFPSILGYFNFPGRPHTALTENTPFVFQQFLIFDPYDASVKEINADELIRSIDFFALQCRFRLSYPIKSSDFYVQHVE